VRVREIWAAASGRLEAAGKPDSRIEAEVLVRHALEVERATFYASLDQDLSLGEVTRVDTLVERRLSGEPLPYITGSREFYGLDFVVDERVLIPRPETELLVDKVVEFAGDEPDGRPLTVADVGTGSGVIAVALTTQLPQAKVVAIDVSKAALEVAAINASRHGVDDRVELRVGDLLGPLDGPVDVIVSNPPYLTDEEMAGLPVELRREPPVSFRGGEDGLSVTSRLIERAPDYLEPRGLLAVEVGHGQATAVMDMAQRAFSTAEVDCYEDLAGVPRVVSVRQPKAGKLGGDLEHRTFEVRELTT
jgi:release factor glutamine methyltransferase